MMRSLYAGVSGLKTHQIKMDVIGNNIANVNTVAYKSSSITFGELMYQTSQNASGANAATGRAGVNAKQIGLGVKSGAISTSIATAGASQTTGNPFDIQITGDSFFIVSDGSANYFTRSGAFTVDSLGTLCMTSNGYTVQGWKTDADGNIIKDTVSALKIMSAENMISNPEATEQAYMTAILDKNSSAVKSTDGLAVNIGIYDNLGYNYTAKFSIKMAKDGGGNYIENAYTMTLTDIINSNSKSIFGDTIDATEQAMLTTAMGGTSISVTFNPSTGALATINGTAYDATDADTGQFTLNLATALGTTFPGFTEAVSVDIATVKNIDNKGTSTINGKSGNIKTGLGAGRRKGDMTGVAIGTDGKITASYGNGTTKLLGQIAVASFANASGLKKEGENLYSATLNSGEFDGIGQDVTADSGGMSTGVLEMSNVDLSAEFTEMITTQRGFQANSRIITVSDTLLEELVNLKR